MGGRGSGRQPSFPTTLEDHLALDLRYLHRHRCLSPGYSGTLRWLRNGKVTSSIGFAVSTDRLTLNYRNRDPSRSEWMDIAESIRLLRTRQPFGGARPWLACPGCARRCLLLYGGRYFRCRRCVGVPYASQCEPTHERLLRRLQAIRARLGGDEYASLGMPFPPRPKRMRQITYDRLRARALAVSQAMNTAAVARFGILADGLDDMD